MNTRIHDFAGILLLTIVSCGPHQQSGVAQTTMAATTDKGVSPPRLPLPYATESIKNYCDVIGWPEGKKPVAPQGFLVTKFANGLKNPRWVYVGPNGDIFVCESAGKSNIAKSTAAIVSGKAKAGNVTLPKNVSANRITIYRDGNNDGIPEVKETFLTGLYHPLGMLILGDKFYVANNDAVISYPYQAGQTKIEAKGTKVTDIPGGSGHWTRNILSSKDGKKIYIAVGSGSNVAEGGMEKETGRAAIWVMNPDGSGKRIFASGLRNPVGLAWAPGTNTLWTAVNERDELGDELVPDYITSVKDGGFYGWPYSYWGHIEDPRLKNQRPDLVKTAIAPNVSMGSHTAALGLAFDEAGKMPGRYKGGAFVGQHGSWNRSKLAGYAVVFVPFRNGKATGNMEPFLTGFVADSSESKVYGRPVGVAFTKNGDMVVADDAANTIWRVSPSK